MKEDVSISLLCLFLYFNLILVDALWTHHDSEITEVSGV